MSADSCRLYTYLPTAVFFEFQFYGMCYTYMLSASPRFCEGKRIRLAPVCQALFRAACFLYVRDRWMGKLKRESTDRTT